VLCRRIHTYLPELFTFVGDPALSSTNNAAERSVRPVVCQRKISGGTRSPEGTRTFTTLRPCSAPGVPAASIHWWLAVTSCSLRQPRQSEQLRARHWHAAQPHPV
jgi:hypothetical protein